MVRGIRGAITIKSNNEKDVLEASKELVQVLISSNRIEPENVAQVLFTVTEDVTAAFPAKVLREFEGWSYVPVVCAQEIPVPGSLPLCIRVLLTVNTDVKQKEVKHAYLRDAVKLRPDLTLTNE
ncbi:chorismate mutase II [Halalkalibacter wakoensis JCM 9140]|uniref:chorismate mutase n=1 Tax=Halalkalibacter wakoensis JCM 9140 TaxID=1236970 RepID=W4Q037_9BACI|nr:chorismate mutase [Halalkalibacter wakoensis]GAE25078.1 chorismate mutase II [Halalkalibacter wakoensis JCM 9140]